MKGALMCVEGASFWRTVALRWLKGAFLTRTLAPVSSRRSDKMTTRAAIGRRAELAVADYLVVEGYELLGRNVRLGSLELDLVARKGPLVVVVEVRTRGRTSLETAFESIGPRKRQRLQRAVGRLWRERLAQMPGVERVQIDVAAVTFDGRETRVEYVARAIEP